MSRETRRSVRKPATKFPQLQKKLGKAQAGQAGKKPAKKKRRP